MTLDEFAASTQRVIAKEGFDDFQPTTLYPERCHIKGFDGFPDDIEPEEPVLRWAADGAREGEEFLVVFKVDDLHFKGDPADWTLLGGSNIYCCRA